MFFPSSSFRLFELPNEALVPFPKNALLSPFHQPDATPSPVASQYISRCARRRLTSVLPERRLRLACCLAAASWENGMSDALGFFS
jgi:hypothetical protein